MKIAIAQVNPTIGNLQINKEKVIEQISLANTQEADLVVFGEMALTGAPLYDLPLVENEAENVWQELSEIAEYAKSIDVLIGLPAVINGQVFNTAVHIQNGEIVNEFYQAMVIDKSSVPYITGIESEDFETETPLENIINVKGENLLVAIGEDVNFIDELEVFDRGAKPYISAVVHMEAQRYVHHIGYNKTSLRQETAKEIKRPIISTNIVGGTSEVVFYGGSTVVNAKGELILQLKAFEEELAVIEMADINEFKPIANKKLTPKGKSREMFTGLTLALKDYMSKRSFKKACFGLSGGIDSAVILSLAVKALGAENVEVLLMPSKFSTDHSVSDAEQMAKNLGVKYHLTPIKECYEATINTMSPLFGDLPFSLAEENIQARLRGVLLMALSNKFGHILLNTSNKSEAAMGYGTLYGDTNGSLSLLGDLYKYEVYDLARYANNESEVIPQNIIDKAPSAELRPGQKDSDSIPDYAVLDKILYQMIEEGKTTEQIIKGGADADAVKKAARLLAVTEFKRHQLPPTIRMSEVTLGVDRTMPI